jgi:tetratricopeptide (TPR) repeat protein
MVMMGCSKRDCDFLTPVDSQDREYAALMDSVETAVCDAKSVFFSDTLLMPVLAFYEEDVSCRHLWMQARCHYLLGSLLYGQDKQEQATAQFLQALELLDEHFDESQTPVGQLYSKIHFLTTRVAHLFSDEQISAQFGRLGLNYAVAVGDTSWMLRSMANLGIMYERFGKPGEGDSAYYYCDGGLAMADAQRFPYETAMLENVLANCLRHSHHYDEAISHFEKAGSLIDSTYLLYYRNYLEMAFVYYKRQDYDSAVVYLEKAFKAEDESIKTQSAFGLADCYEEMGDTLKAMPYYNIVKAHQEKQVVMANQNGEAMPMLNAYLRGRTSPGNHPVLFWVAIAIVLLALMTVVFVAKRKAKAKEVQHMEEVKRLQAMLEQSAQHQRELLKQRVLTIYQTAGGDRLSRILGEFEGAYPSAGDRFEQSCPSLNETERRIIILSFLGLRAKEVADLLGLKENTVTQYRSNLKKKADINGFSSYIG